MQTEYPVGYSKDNGFGKPTHLLHRKDGWVRTPPGYCLREDGLKSHSYYAGKWYETPTQEELECWSYDGVCETPDGDIVEPDHPRSWLCLLGFI